MMEEKDKWEMEEKDKWEMKENKNKK